MDLLEPSCRVCGCTFFDCRQCIEKTGEPCHWLEADLCSACKGEVKNVSVACQFHFVNFKRQFTLTFETSVVVGSEADMLEDICLINLKKKVVLDIEIDEIKYKYI
jgi:hypothetical protein